MNKYKSLPITRKGIVAYNKILFKPQNDSEDVNLVN